MPVGFLGIAATNDGSQTSATNDGSQTTPRSGAGFDKEYPPKLARAYEDQGWDRVLFDHGSGSPDPAPAAAYIARRPDGLRGLGEAHRTVGTSRAREEVAESDARPGPRTLTAVLG